MNKRKRKKKYKSSAEYLENILNTSNLDKFMIKAVKDLLIFGQAIIDPDELTFNQDKKDFFKIKVK